MTMVPGLALLCALGLGAQPPAEVAVKSPSNYVLGPDDQVVITALDVEEISNKPIRIDAQGNVSLPMVGRIHAAGLTPEQLETQLAARLKKYLQEPQVAVTIAEYRSQPVSVLGSVANPGVQQLQGRKTLFEILSMAGGLRTDAGYSIKITRRKEWGAIPLPNAADDDSGQFSVAEVNVKSVMEAKNPKENVLIRPYDVISVPRGELVYVVGAVKKSGGFVLGQKERVSVLEALSLAEGLEHTAAPKRAKILRVVENSPQQRAEVAVNLRDVLAGKAPDVSLQADDILFVPNSATESATIKGLEAMLQVGTGIAIYRR